MLYLHDLFLAHAKERTNAARDIKEKANEKGLDVYLATEDLRPPSERWQNEIREALLRSRNLAVLASPEILNNEWVQTEWSAAWLLKKGLTAILLGLKREKLPRRLQDYQTADYYQVDDYLDRLATKKTQGYDTSIFEALRIHESMAETVFAPRILNSPLAFDAFVKLARKHILISGQNLHYILVRYCKETKKTLWNFLEENNERRVEILICDPRDEHSIETWKTVTAEHYEIDLKDAFKNLKILVKDAKERNLNFEARTIPFVPLSVTFLDPKDPNGMLAFTPNFHQEKPGERGTFFLHRSLHENIFSTFVDNYLEVFGRGKIIP